jgi:hypothetical protein
MPDGTVVGGTFDSIEFDEALAGARAASVRRRRPLPRFDDEGGVDMGFGDDPSTLGEAGEAGRMDDGEGVDLDIEPESTFNQSIATDWVIDGLIPEGIAAIAGQPGVGKSSMIGTLALIVTGLLRHDTARDGLQGGPVGGAFGIRCSYPRRVVWVTEDTTQARQIIRGLCVRWGLTFEDVGKMLRLVRGRRLPTDALVQALGRELMQKKPGERDQPLLIIDTISSSLDLEDENDNAGVARAIDTIKNAFFRKDEGSVWLIGHTSKPTSRTDSSATMRGASSIGGNVNATYALVMDTEVPASRFLVLGKVRSGRDAAEIEFAGEPFTESSVNRHGDKVQTKVIISTARPLGAGEREKVKDNERIPALHAEIVRIVDEARPCFMQKGSGNFAKPEGYTKLVARDAVRQAVSSINLNISHEARDLIEASFNTIAPPTSETERFFLWD